MAGDPLTSAAEQAAVNPLPDNLNLVLNAKNSVTIGSVANINGDVGSSGPSGSVFFDMGATQGYYYYYGYVLASSVQVAVGA